MFPTFSIFIQIYVRPLSYLYKCDVYLIVQFEAYQSIMYFKIHLQANCEQGLPTLYVIINSCRHTMPRCTHATFINFLFCMFKLMDMSQNCLTLVHLEYACRHVTDVCNAENNKL